MPSIPEVVDDCHPSARRYPVSKFSFDIPVNVAGMTDRAIDSRTHAGDAPIDLDVSAQALLGVIHVVKMFGVPERRLREKAA